MNQNNKMSDASKNINHGDIKAGGAVIIGDNNEVKIQHILGNLQDYQNLEQEIAETREVFNAIALDKQEIRLKLSGTLEAKKEKLENIKKAIEQAFEYISKLTISTDRLDQAKALFLEGDIPGALEILKDEAIQADYLALQTVKQSEEERHSRRMEEITEKTKGIAEEWKMKAVLMATQYEDGEWFEKTKGYYEKALEVDRDVEYLFDYANFLKEHKQYKDATPFYEEALEIRRTFARTNPQTFLPDLATTLNNLGVLHWNTNNLEQAEAEHKEALEIRRTLAQTNPQAFLPDVATTLNSLGVLHWNKNELEKAEREFEESLEIRRFLSQTNPQTFLLYVATTLSNLAGLHWKINKLEKAEREFEKALELCRSFAQADSQTFLPYVAVILTNMGVLHRDKNELEKAEIKYEEALEIRRFLARTNPQAFLPDLAMTLNNMVILYLDKNELEKAEGTCKEALEIRRFLAQTNPQAFFPDVAQTLNNLAIIHSAKNEHRLAGAIYKEALVIYQSLAQSNPQAFLPQIANTASNMAKFYQDKKSDRESSLALVREALRAAMPFGSYLKFAQDSIERAKVVIEKWGLDVEEFLKELEEENK